MENNPYSTILRAAWLLVTAALLGGLVAYLVTDRMERRYEATATLLVNARVAGQPLEVTSLEASQRLASTVARVIVVDSVLEQAIQDGALPLSLAELRRSVSSEHVPETAIVELAARANSSNRAAQVANAVADSFLGSASADLAVPTRTVQVIERARPPEQPIAPRPLMNVALGAALSALAAAGLVMLLERLDGSVRSRQQVERATGLRALGEIRMRPPRGGDWTTSRLRERSGAAEGYRSIRTRLLQVAMGDRDLPLLVMLASPRKGDGKTTSAANLAVAFGLSGHRTCVVDADLRQPQMHSVFQTRSTQGVAGLLSSEERRDADVGAALLRTQHRNVTLLPAGATREHPAELLGSARLPPLLGRLREMFDVVIVDTPAAVPFTDAAIVAPLVDAVVLVARAGHTAVEEIDTLAEDLSSVGGPIAGIVLTGTPEHREQYDWAEVGEDGLQPRRPFREQATRAWRRVTRRRRPASLAGRGWDEGL